PFLRLEDAQGNKLAENDDIEPGVIVNSRIVFTPKEGGTYRLVATGFRGQGTGADRLVLRTFAPEKRRAEAWHATPLPTGRCRKGKGGDDARVRAVASLTRPRLPVTMRACCCTALLS